MYKDEVNRSPFTQAALLLLRRPQAEAQLHGSDKHPALRGTVRFYQTEAGVLVAAAVEGLPESGAACPSDIFAFHIHSGGRCAGNAQDPFADALTHYDPGHCPHPGHAGDMPPLFGSGGRALQLFMTDRFTVEEVVGKTVIVHAKPDDFTTQPSGAAGEKIACGVIYYA
ncbi:MAG: superoxide dismutase family protein [Oscillospiraceae bacterium]